MSPETMSDNIQNYVNDFNQLKIDDWLDESRHSALKLFKESGFPNSKLENFTF